MLQWWVGKIYIYKRETLIWYTANNKQTTKKKTYTKLHGEEGIGIS
jgi:hypothetical protein